MLLMMNSCQDPEEHTQRIILKENNETFNVHAEGNKTSSSQLTPIAASSKLPLNSQGIRFDNSNDSPRIKITDDRI